MTSFLLRSGGRTQKREICCIVKSKKNKLISLFEILAAQLGFHPNWAGRVQHHIVAEQKKKQLEEMRLSLNQGEEEPNTALC